MLVKNCKLDVGEAERFLRGTATDPQRVMLIARLRPDRERLLENFKKVKSKDYGEMTWVLTQHLRAQLSEINRP